MEMKDLLVKLDELRKIAVMHDNQRCGDDRYDEGYADAMYDAITMIKELVEVA